MNSQIKLSQHLMKERAGRYAFIATTVGLGEIVHRHARRHTGDNRAVMVNITSTGVVMVEGDDQSIVTMYLANITEIEQYFDNASVPWLLAARVKTNMSQGLVKRQNDFD